MPMRFVTGRARALKRRLMDELGGALRENGRHALILLVPEQYTLQAELDAIDALDLPGSFRLQVLSPARLFSRIFSEAGRPTGVRIDERGRVMMMYLALRQLSGELQWYKGAQHRSGFPELMMDQIKEFKQSGMTPETLAEAIDQLPEGALRAKMNDLMIMWQAYDRALGGRFLDGEDELFEALRRAPEAGFLSGCEVWAYGFELVSATLARTLIALTGCARRVTLALALENDGGARDFQVFEPVQRSFERLMRHVRGAGVEWERVKVSDEADDADLPGDIRHLEREMCCYPHQKSAHAPGAVQLASLKNPLGEAMFAAALARQLVKKHNWRWRDVAVGLNSLEGYADVLERAFSLYGVPLFLESDQPAGRHPAAQYLLLALKLTLTGWQIDDARLLLRTGYAGLDDDECDQMINYAVQFGLRGNGWIRPLTRGDEPTRAQIEPLRARLVAPLIELQTRLKAAERVSDQLRAIWGLLETTAAHKKLERERQQLTSLGLSLRANESAQVWNRLIGTLDQLHELLGDSHIPARELMEMLSQSLMASAIKPLPQSGDAVEAGSLSRMRGHPVKALILLGMSDRHGGAEPGVLMPAERQALSGIKGVWLGPDANERALLQMLDLKAALSLARRFVIVTYPQSDAEGAALSPGTLPNWIRRLFPRLSVRGGLFGEESMRRMLLAAPEAALQLAAPSLRAAEGDDAAARAAFQALLSMPEHLEKARRVERALRHRVYSQPLQPATARSLYSGPTSVSVSRLEQYAACPFQHFVHYGLRPEPLTPYEFTPQDRGSFLHDALDRYIKALGRPGEADMEQSLNLMDEVTESLLQPMMDGPLGEDPVMMSYGHQLRRIARRTARSIARQFEGSKFQPSQTEVDFNRLDAKQLLGEPSDEPLTLKGRIDRIDRWTGDTGVWLRVVDYKTGNAKLNPAELYFGLQLQLIVYLAAALSTEGGRPAGAFYFHVDDPLVSTFERDPKAIEREREKMTRLNGMVIDDREVIDAMSPEPEQVLGLTLNRDFSVRKGGMAFSEAQFIQLTRHALRAAGRIAREIRAGATDISPAQVKARLSCAYCEYASVCQMDPQLPGGEPRRIPSMRVDELLQKIDKENKPCD